MFTSLNKYSDSEPSQPHKIDTLFNYYCLIFKFIQVSGVTRDVFGYTREVSWPFIENWIFVADIIYAKDGPSYIVCPTWIQM